MMKSVLQVDLIKSQIDYAVRHLMSEINRDASAPAFGCFDRRYWAWKLVDFPEATFQRNVFPLAWYWNRHTTDPVIEREGLRQAIIAGLLYTFQIQHKDGSFDQAFPHEHSYGATAFILQPLLLTYQIMSAELSASDRAICQTGLQRAARFLTSHAETHDLISNHLAGAALALLHSGDFFHQSEFTTTGNKLIDFILKHQDPEGWFPEYGGADPGYQSLCLYYLSQASDYFHTDHTLHNALGKAVEFLACFIHPDGSFAGEYGSRRTSIYYPGGIALLACKNATAAAMTHRMLDSIAKGKTVTVQDVDMGNFAPLLQNLILAYKVVSESQLKLQKPLPCDAENLCMDFPNAGISVRANKRYYAIIGVSNGGVVKVFERNTGKTLFNDAGYWGILTNQRKVSTQFTILGRPSQRSDSEIYFEAPFYEVLASIPNPFQFVILRILNITVMRSIVVGNLIKKLLVQLLIKGQRKIALRLLRRICFSEESIEIEDSIIADSRLKLQQLSCGSPFVSIHMASARYYPSVYEAGEDSKNVVEVASLNQGGTVMNRIVIQ